MSTMYSIEKKNQYSSKFLVEHINENLIAQFDQIWHKYKSGSKPNWLGTTYILI